MRAGEGDDSAKQASITPSHRPTPANKEVWATLEGKDIAFDRLARRVAQRDTTQVQQRVALTDGDEALQNQVGEKLSGFELILDVIHASEYLWDTANALLGETNPDRTAWVGEQLLQVLCNILWLWPFSTKFGTATPGRGGTTTHYGRIVPCQQAWQPLGMYSQLVCSDRDSEAKRCVHRCY